jgi:hypothetical protein
MDLVDQIKKQFSDSDISELSSMIGASEGATRSAVGAAVPTILSALSRLASSDAGAQKIVSALGQVNVGPGGTIAMPSGAAAVEKGGNLLNSLLSGSSLSGIQNGITRFAGVAWGGCQKLLSALTPTILGTIASRFAGRSVNAQGLAGLFAAEKASIANAIPAGLSLPDVPGAVGSAAAGARQAAGAVGHAAGSAARSAAAGADAAARTGVNWLLPVLALLALGLVAWWLWPKSKITPPTVPDLTAQAAAWKSDTASAVTRLSEELGNIKDAASLDAAIPKLKELETKLGDARSRIADMPSAARSAVSTMVTPMLATIREKITNVLNLPGAAEKVKPLLDSIFAKLSALS